MSTSKTLATSLHASSLTALDAKEREQLLSTLSHEEALALLYDWQFWARPNQLAPEGDWEFWCLMAGRGFGKTRTAGEWIREKAEEYPGVRIALVGRTAADARDVMVEGESGLLAISPPWFMPDYQPGKRRVVWPNGSMGITYSGDEPAQLRGPQHHFAWGDEVAEWKRPEALDNLAMGLRLDNRGNRPQAVFSFTPRRVKHVRELLKDPRAALTSGTTYDNIANLAPSFINRTIKKYEGTRLGRQELLAQLLEEQEGALWNHALLDNLRVTSTPQLELIVVGVDPSVSANPDSAETGIIVAGRGVNGHAYVLDDASIQGTPKQWGDATVAAYNKYRANKVVPEKNNGGDLVASNIRASDPNIPVEPVWASRGKYTRAEPVSTLYEKGMVHHVGSFALLEDQMCEWMPGSDDSPDRMDALVWAITELMLPKEGSQGEVYSLSYSGLYGSGS